MNSLPEIIFILHQVTESGNFLMEFNHCHVRYIGNAKRPCGELSSSPKIYWLTDVKLNELKTALADVRAP